MGHTNKNWLFKVRMEHGMEGSNVNLSNLERIQSLIVSPRVISLLFDPNQR